MNQQGEYKPASLAGKRALMRAAREDKQYRKGMPYIRILPLTIIMALMMFSLKLRDIYTGVETLGIVNVAVAQERNQEEVAANLKNSNKTAPPSSNLDISKLSVEEMEALLSDQQRDMIKEKVLEEKFKVARERQFSNVELDILQSLSARRSELENRARELDLKEKLIEATEVRINDKISEMKALEKKVDDLLAAYDSKHSNEILGLVRIYESMKPSSASQIFNELDMPILLEVIDRMSERKVAPVLAGMNPMRAKEVTEQLAVMRKLSTQTN